MSKGNILSGMRPTGRLHLGHQHLLHNWRKLQDEYSCYFFVADWHALTTGWEEAKDIRSNTIEMVADWLANGIDPDKSVIFVQSDVPEHAELHLLLSMITPLSWLERVPTYKEQLRKLGEMGKDINTYGFLGYPLLQAADILVYKPTAVPVGEDQLPHVELTREIARRFNHLFAPVFPEPQGVINEKVETLPGVDGAKMSKSYHNFISIGATADELKQRVNAMITDPARIRKDDPGHPEVCVVHKFHNFYGKSEIEEITEHCRSGQIGCVACKKKLIAAMDLIQAPVRERRAEIMAKPGYVEEVLRDGAAKAGAVARTTLADVRRAIFG